MSLDERVVPMDSLKFILSDCAVSNSNAAFAIGAAFFGGIVMSQSLLRPMTGGSEIAVAVSTLASFALFQPMRRCIQSSVDRRFYRARYDAGRMLDTFSGQVANEVDLDALRSDLLTVVGQTMQPAHASLWLRR